MKIGAVGKSECWLSVALPFFSSSEYFLPLKSSLQLLGGMDIFSMATVLSILLGLGVK
jgi:hypothetical protein